MDAEFWYRMVLLSLSSFLGGATLVICTLHYLVWRRNRSDWKGLLPLHVFTVTASYDLMLAYSTVETMIRISTADDVVWWRAVLLIPAYVTGFVAVWAISRFASQKRLKVPA